MECGGLAAAFKTSTSLPELAEVQVRLFCPLPNLFGNPLLPLPTFNPACALSPSSTLLRVAKRFAVGPIYFSSALR